MPTRCASSTSSSAWLAPSRNEKFDLHQSGAYGCIWTSVQMWRYGVNGGGQRSVSWLETRAKHGACHAGAVPRELPQPVIQVHHRGARGVDGILRLIELAAHDGPIDVMLSAMCDEIAAIAAADI